MQKVGGSPHKSSDLRRLSWEYAHSNEPITRLFGTGGGVWVLTRTRRRPARSRPASLFRSCSLCSTLLNCRKTKHSREKVTWRAESSIIKSLMRCSSGAARWCSGQHRGPRSWFSFHVDFLRPCCIWDVDLGENKIFNIFLHQNKNV